MLKKILNADYKGIFAVLNDMKKRSKRNRIDLFIDMYKEYKNNGHTWQSFYTYNFDRVRDKDIRSTFISQYGDNSKIYKKFVNDSDYKYLMDKTYFYEEYKDFLGRDVLTIRDKEFEKFNNFLDKHNIIFAKDAFSCGGYGVERIDITNLDRKELFDRLIKEGKVIVEEAIKQHPEMSKLSLNSVNTIRTATAVDNEGNVSILYTVLRISGSDSFLDNASQGGYWTVLSEDGVITKPLYKKNPVEKLMTKNELTGVNYIGFKIPMFSEVKELAIKAASLHKSLRYIGWDIAISEKGPLIIEGNNFPTTELYQSYVHLEDGRGMVKDFEKKLGIKLR